MKRKTIITLFAGCLTVFSPAIFAAPRLTMYEDAFNFGYIPRQAAVSHDFWLFSTGDEPLLILQVVPGCSCTQAPLEKKTVPVGDSSKLEIVFHSRTFTHGLTKRPTIATNEGPEVKTLQILSYVVTNPDSTYPIKIEPWKIELNGSPEASNAEATFTLTNLTNAPLSTDIIALPEAFLTVELPSTIPPNGTAKGSIRVKESQLKKVFEKSVTFELNDAAKSRFTIPIKRTYRSPKAASGLEDTLMQVFGTDKK